MPFSIYNELNCSAPNGPTTETFNKFSSIISPNLNKLLEQI